MLGVPLGGCGGGTQKPVMTSSRCDATCKAKADEQEKHDAEAKAAADEQAKHDAELVAQKQAEEEAARKAEEDRKAEEERKAEEQRQAEEAAAAARIRGSGKGVRGRGFVLA